MQTTYTNVYRFGTVEIVHETGRTHELRQDAISDIIDYCDGEYVGTLVQTGDDYCLVSYLEMAEAQRDEEKTAWVEERKDIQAAYTRLTGAF